MKLIFYLYKKFFATFLVSLLFFVLVLCLTDLFLNLWNYISHSVSPSRVALVLLYYMPKAVWYSVPIAVLFASSYVLSDLYAKNELLAIFASGISLLRFTLPLLVLSIAMSFALFWFEDSFVVQTYAKKTSLQTELLGTAQSLNNDTITVMADEGRIIYKANFFDNSLNRLYGVEFLFRTKEKAFDALILAESALWTGSHWEIGPASMYTKEGDNGFTLSFPTAEYENRLTEPPETFRNNTVSVEEVDTKQARLYIEHLTRAGLPSAEARSVYYKKFAFPSVVFIVVFLAIGLSGKTRKNVLLVSLALSIFAVVLFYVMQMVTMLMAKFEAIPPVFGAWFPVVFFIFASIILLRYAKT